MGVSLAGLPLFSSGQQVLIMAEGGECQHCFVSYVFQKGGEAS